MKPSDTSTISLLLAAGAFLFTLITAWRRDASKADTADLDKRIAVLESQQNSVKGEIADLEKKVDELSRQVGSIREDLREIKTLLKAIVEDHHRTKEQAP